MKNTPRFPSFKQSESLQFFNDIVKLCLQSKLETIKKPFDKILAINNELENAYKQEKGSDLTETLIQYDQRRDDAVVCVRLMAVAYTNHFFEEKRDSAAKVLKTIDKYGKSLHRLNYQSETSTLFNLSKDLQASDMAEAVAQINMTEVVAEMHESNNLFNEAFLNRVQETAANEQVATGTLLHKAIALYRELITYIEAYNTINPSEEYDALLKQIDELTTKYNSLANTRTSTKEEKFEF